MGVSTRSHATIDEEEKAVLRPLLEHAATDLGFTATAEDLERLFPAVGSAIAQTVVEYFAKQTSGKGAGDKFLANAMFSGGPPKK